MECQEQVVNDVFNPYAAIGSNIEFTCRGPTMISMLLTAHFVATPVDLDLRPKFIFVAVFASNA